MEDDRDDATIAAALSALAIATEQAVVAFEQFHDAAMEVRLRRASMESKTEALGSAFVAGRRFGCISNALFIDAPERFDHVDMGKTTRVKKPYYRMNERW